MNIISFSLYGDQKKYTIGALKNAELAAKFYPGWRCIYHVSLSVPMETTSALLRMDNVELVYLDDYNALLPVGDNNIPGMFTRFMAFDGPYDYVISRDVDSRIDAREVAAVNQWIESGKKLHVMRDHFAHARPINGGLWGLKLKLEHQSHIEFQMMKKALVWCNQQNGRPIDYGDDQQFLCSIVWPHFNHSVMEHDSFSRHAYKNARPFPTKRIGQDFCGQVFDENDVPRDFDRVQIPLEP